jgi:hypothetical protein
MNMPVRIAGEFAQGAPRGTASGGDLRDMEGIDRCIAIGKTILSRVGLLAGGHRAIW